MGKTALAREAAAWWLRKGRFDSAVFCSFEQKVEADRVVQLIGKALEGESFSSRLAEDQWATAVRLFHQRKVLLVWDNFESTLPIFQNGQPPSTDKETTDAVESPLEFGAEERGRLQRLYRELTDGSPEGRLLVTCRPANTNLPAIKELALEGLARPDSLHLLAAVTGLKNIATDRPGCDRTEIDALLDALDDHPLSIQLVAPHLEKMTPARIRSEFGTLLSRFADENVDEPRNRSLLASMEFSKTRLSEAAQKVLPYLAWFKGGGFKQFLLDFAELEAGTWEPIRSELVATALVSVDEDIQISDPPYLRFHPTLRYAATTEQVPDREAAERRFIGVYRSVAGAANQALRGNQPANGMALLAREEANLRIAIDRAFRRGDRQEGGNMADTLRIYLESAGRLRERDALVAWVRGQLSEGGELDGVTSGSIRQHAWSLLTQGHAAEAIQMVKTLITRLETEDLAGGADPTFQLAVSQAYLGRIYYTSGHNNLALAPLQMAITRFEQLGHDARDNVSATLGSLANAYSSLGQLDRALEVAERGLAIRQELGNQREIATGLGRTAQILMAQQRYSEADARYTEAFEAAEAAGDLGVQGSLLQHQGSLQDEMGNLDRSIELYKEAITLFQRATNRGAEMRTCNQLATAERALGHLDAAEAWYARSRELAKQLNDKPQLAVVAQNTGILYQTQAENEGDPVKQAVLLSRAVDSVEESLDIKLDMENQLAAAASYGQLGILQRMLGNLGLAEENARMSLGIYESLDLPNVSLNYRDLAEIARQRGDQEAAAQWQAKYEAKEAELERLRRGQDPDSEAGEEAEQ